MKPSPIWDATLSNTKTIYDPTQTLRTQLESEDPSPEKSNHAVKDDFSLQKVLGQGGMGTVYRARQHSLERTVALKINKSTGSNEQQFIAEASLNGELDHPHIIPVYQIGRTGEIITEHSQKDALFYSMPEIEGKPGRTYLPTNSSQLSNIKDS